MHAAPNAPLGIAFRCFTRETALRDRFSPHGYQRKTNAELAKESNVIVYTDISSCGTSTNVSVPCMLDVASARDRKDAPHRANCTAVQGKTSPAIRTPAPRSAAGVIRYNELQHRIGTLFRKVT